MSLQQASRTVFGTAYMRAAHQLFDPPPRILDDSVILKLLDQHTVDRISRNFQDYQTPERRALRAHVALRSRVAEDRLASAAQRGITQYVILGAGLDTFAFRQPEWARPLRIIEVDHPGTQTAKQKLLTTSGLPVPGNVSFAAINFECETLHDVLMRYQVSLEQRAFFSWLGVTMYLNENTIDSILNFIAAFPQENEVVLSFARADGPPSPFEVRAEELGEKWLSRFTPETMEAKLRSSGFQSVEFLSARDAENLYFKNLNASLPVPQRTKIVIARV